jgi:uncharacterized membrane protein
MDVRLALAAYVPAGLAILFGIPMALQFVPPNRYYGYRTQKTLSSPSLWYRANRVAGWAMLLSGLAALSHNLWLQHAHSDWPSATQQLIMTLSTAAVLFSGLIISAFYVRKLR